MEGGAGSVYALAHDAVAGRLYAASGRSINLFSLEDGAWLSTLSRHSGDVYAIALGADVLLSGGDDGRVCEWARPSLAADVEEEPEPLATLELARGQSSTEGRENPRLSLSCLSGLGDRPAAFLAGTWQGDVLTAASRKPLRCFGRALLRDNSPTPEVPVTALAARLDLVAVGHENGALRLMWLDDVQEAPL